MAIAIGSSLVPFLLPEAIETLPFAVGNAIIAVKELDWFG
jgi:hypothetical protein